jgi:hypothetical protein
LGEPEHVDLSDSPESTVFYHSDHAGTCFPAMEDIRRLGKLCDVTLIVGKDFYILVEKISCTLVSLWVSACLASKWRGNTASGSQLSSFGLSFPFMESAFILKNDLKQSIRVLTGYF